MSKREPDTKIEAGKGFHNFCNSGLNRKKNTDRTLTRKLINYKITSYQQKKDGCYFKFNEKVLFRTDSKTQMEYFKTAVGGSVMTANEARRKLDLPDREGGDVLLANGSMVPLTMAGAAYTKGQQIPDDPEDPDNITDPETDPDNITDPETDPDKIIDPDDPDRDKDGEE